MNGVRELPECTGQSPQLGLRLGNLLIHSGHTGADHPDKGLEYVHKLVYPGKQVLGNGVADSAAHSGVACPILGPSPSTALRRCCGWDMLPVPASGAQPPLLAPHRATLHGLRCSVLLLLTWSPVSFRLGCVPRHGQCALVLCPPRAGPVLLCPGSRAKLRGHLSPYPARLWDNVNLVSLAQQGCCCSSILRNVSGSSEPPVLLAEATSVSKGLRLWSWPHKMEISTSRSQGQMCVLNVRHSTVFAFTQAGVWRPQTGIHLINGLVLSRILCWNPDSRL